MMTAYIIFSDGSRQLSHNNDDLRERWELRREIDSDLLCRESVVGYEIPVLHNFDDDERVFGMLATYKEMLIGIEARTAFIGSEKPRTISKKHLGRAKQELLAQISILKDQIKLINIRRANTEDRQYIHELTPYIRELEARLMRLGEPLPQAPSRWQKGKKRVGKRDDGAA